MAYKKVLLLGNSLLLGMFDTYGMCSTDPQSDYAYYLTQELVAREPNCKISKLRISQFEMCESVEDFEAWFSMALPYFESDLDLISFQLMDNVNNEARWEAFRKTFPELLRRAKELCPNARIIWVHGWYNQPTILDFANQTVAELGVENIDIGATRKKENESYRGQISLNAEGEQIVVDDTWVTHPGNKGMREIADILISKLF